jgi:hypothetical protein
VPPFLHSLPENPDKSTHVSQGIPEVNPYHLGPHGCYAVFTAKTYEDKFLIKTVANFFYKTSYIKTGPF